MTDTWPPAFAARLDEYRARYTTARDDRSEEPDPGTPNWEVQREMASEGLRPPVGLPGEEELCA